MTPEQFKIDYAFTPVPNWLVDMLMITMLSKRQSQAIQIITSKSYGEVTNIFTHERREYAKIGTAYIAEVTNTFESNASRTLKELKDRKIIICTDAGIKINDKLLAWLKSDLSTTIIKRNDKLSTAIMKAIGNDNNLISPEITIKERRTAIKEAKVLNSGVPAKGKEIPKPQLDKMREILKKEGIEELKNHEEYKNP